MVSRGHAAGGAESTEEQVMRGEDGFTQARDESGQPAATGTDASRTVEGSDAVSPARRAAKDRDDSAGKRGRQKMARLVRMHGGLIVEGGR